MIGRGAGDRGQAFPLYIVAMAGLLFAVFLFVVVGMAGDTRSDAQGAADAAALAAAREARDTVFAGGDLLALTSADWERILGGNRFELTGACAKAAAFAASNGATAECEPHLPKFTVAVTTDDTVGKSVVPGSESVHGKATATAEIEPRCTLVSGPAPSPTPEPTPTGTASPSPSPSVTPKPSVVSLSCKDGRSVDVDPSKPGPLTQLARKLFSVRLTD
ncbi:pilus assembly protein TadG-related protein [Streptomyces goshikiensis]|uniref:pilus assembly protein TadG-related protein n=1 Tax=Streptomyces goshikiensis TaxID=1942 RepID=UPI0036A36319